MNPTMIQPDYESTFFKIHSNLSLYTRTKMDGWVLR